MNRSPAGAAWAQAAAVDGEIQKFTTHVKGPMTKSEGAYRETLAHVRQEADRVVTALRGER